MSSDKKCCVPGCFEAGGASHSRLHVFPNPKKDPERFEAWRLSVGGHILELTNENIYKYRRVCHAHFEEKFHCRYNRLSNIAIPTVNLAGNCSGSKKQQEFVSESEPQEKGTKAENITLMHDEKQDYNDVEYPEEDAYNNADIFENIELSDDYRAHNVKPTIETKLSVDEIYNLFSSYMVTFRNFPSKLQTMLKIDLAKLFARYEMKNAALQCSSDEQQQAKDDTPSTFLLDETKKAEKRIKRNFSQTQPYITTNNPPEILTHSNSMMPISQISNKDIEGANNKSSSKKNKLLKNKAIIKKRVSDTKDNDNIVLQTNDQYQKSMTVRKLEEDNVDSNTSRSLSSSQDSQGTSVILITDRSSKKLTSESDKISQSQKSAS